MKTIRTWRAFILTMVAIGSVFQIGAWSLWTSLIPAFSSLTRTKAAFLEPIIVHEPVATAVQTLAPGHIEISENDSTLSDEFVSLKSENPIKNPAWTVFDDGKPNDPTFGIAAGVSATSELADGAYQWTEQASQGARTYTQQVTQQGLEHGRAMGTHALHWITATDVSDDNNRQATMMLCAGGGALGTVALSYLMYKAYQALIVRPKSVAGRRYELAKQRAQQLAQDALNAFLEKQKRQRRA